MFDEVSPTEVLSKHADMAARSAALQAAVAYHTARNEGTPGITEVRYVLDTAAQFERYIKEGKE